MAEPCSVDGAQGGQRLGQQVRVPLGEGAAEDPLRQQQEVPPVLARSHKPNPRGERSLGGTRGRDRLEKEEFEQRLRDKDEVRGPASFFLPLLISLIARSIRVFCSFSILIQPTLPREPQHSPS